MTTPYRPQAVEPSAGWEPSARAARGALALVALAFALSLSVHLLSYSNWEHYVSSDYGTRTGTSLTAANVLLRLQQFLGRASFMVWFGAVTGAAFALNAAARTCPSPRPRAAFAVAAVAFGLMPLLGLADFYFDLVDLSLAELRARGQQLSTVSVALELAGLLAVAAAGALASREVRASLAPSALLAAGAAVRGGWQAKLLLAPAARASSQHNPFGDRLPTFAGEALCVAGALWLAVALGRAAAARDAAEASAGGRPAPAGESWSTAASGLGLFRSAIVLRIVCGVLFGLVVAGIAANARSQPPAYPSYGSYGGYEGAESSARSAIETLRLATTASVALTTLLTLVSALGLAGYARVPSTSRADVSARVALGLQLSAAWGMLTELAHFFSPHARRASTYGFESILHEAESIERATQLVSLGAALALFASTAALGRYASADGLAARGRTGRVLGSIAMLMVVARPLLGDDPSVQRDPAALGIQALAVLAGLACLVTFFASLREAREVMEQNASGL